MAQKTSTAKIAQLAGVSPATVSRVFNHRELVSDKTVAKVETALKQLGENPNAIAPRTKRRKSVILVNYPLNPNPFYDEVVRGAIVSATAHGCSVIESRGYLTEDTIASFLELVGDLHVSGVITLSQYPSGILGLINKRVALVQCCEFNDDVDTPYVSIDDRSAAKSAVEFLVAAGRTKIALLNGPERYKYARERRAGYLEAMEEAKLEVSADWVMSVPHIEYSLAFTVMSELIVAGKMPDAVFCASDILAAGAINAARRYHLHVPQDLMVVGFDNISTSQMMRPTITTVSQPRYQLGYTAAEVLVDLMANPAAGGGRAKRSEHIFLPTELVVRESAIAR